jgi:hypothetical protein
MHYRVSNSKAQRYVQLKARFKGSNLFSDMVAGNYVVYSYGTHWPLFVFHAESGIWYENMDKRSATTSRHRTQAHPGCGTVLMGHDEILEFVSLG